MIKTNVKKFIDLCAKRNYSLEDVSGCISEKLSENFWVIDETHPSYPRPKDMTHEDFLKYLTTRVEPQKALDIGQGVGTELKNLLKLIGITSTPNCSCNAKAKLMNEKGIQWCKDNVEMIIGWLKEEADKRNLPFFSYGAKKLIKLAIYRAEKSV
jgi:hypothetical protein